MYLVLCSRLNFYRVLLVLSWFLQCLYSDGLSWIDKPSNLTYVQQGKNISIRWHYEITSSEQFLSSELFLISKSLALASRHQGESSYSKYAEIQSLRFSVSGKEDVILAILGAEISYNGVYCCIVTLKLNSGKKAKRECTSLFIYAVPRITYLNPQVFIKQGDSVKLQCTATGYPEPRVRWIHKDTNKIIVDYSLTSLKITGKRSEGRYCCHVINQFGNVTNCTSVIVTEYGPVETTLSTKRGYIIKNETFRLQCRADASPPPQFFVFRNHTLIYISSNGTYITNQVKRKNITGQDKEAVAISCFAKNKYGRGQTKMVILQVYDFPQFTDNLRTRYNMTNSNITITCSATGNPTPNITWTKGDNNEIVSTEEYYNVPYVKCDNKELVYYCHANNVLGWVRSKEIIVHVMTENNDNQKNPQVPWQKQSQYKVELIALGILFMLSLLVNLILVIYIVWQRRKVLQDSRYKENKRELQTNSDVRVSLNATKALDVNSAHNVIPKRVPVYEQVDLDDPVLQGVLTSNADRLGNVSLAAGEQNNQSFQTFALVHNVISLPPHKTVSNPTLGEADEQSGVPELTSAIQSFKVPMYQSVQVTTSNYASLSLSTRFTARNTSLPAAQHQNEAQEATSKLSEYQALRGKSGYQPYQSLEDLSTC